MLSIRFALDSRAMVGRAWEARATDGRCSSNVMQMIERGNPGRKLGVLTDVVRLSNDFFVALGLKKVGSRRGGTHGGMSLT
jgi:hypothetical protein